MRIINVLQVIPDLGLAGAEIMCEQLSYFLQRTNKYRVFVCSLYNKKTAITERMDRKGIQIFYLNKKNGLDIGLIFKLYHLMKQNNIDIVHTHLYAFQYAIPAAILANIPVRIHTVHNIARKEFSYIRRLMIKLFYRFFHLKPVGISPIIAATIAEEYKMPIDQIPVVFNGTDLDCCMIKMDYNSTHGVFKFIHIGRMTFQKNHDLIFAVAKKLKEDGRLFIIYLIGTGEDELRLKNKSIELNLSDVLVFCGLQSNVYSYLQEADCFILPSRYEGMPVTLVEAMGCGIPIIASCVGGIPDMVTNEVSGILIKPTMEELYFAMSKMMDSSSEYRKMLGLNAKKEAERFSLQNMGVGYDRIYQDEIRNRV